MEEKLKEFLNSLSKEDKIKLIYYNGQVFSGIYCRYLEDDEETFITIKEEGKTTGWSFPMKGLKEIQTLNK